MAEGFGGEGGRRGGHRRRREERDVEFERGWVLFWDFLGPLGPLLRSSCREVKCMDGNRIQASDREDDDVIKTVAFLFF